MSRGARFDDLEAFEPALARLEIEGREQLLVGRVAAEARKKLQPALLVTHAGIDENVGDLLDSEHSISLYER